MVMSKSDGMVPYLVWRIEDNDPYLRSGKFLSNVNPIRSLTANRPQLAILTFNVPKWGPQLGCPIVLVIYIITLLDHPKESEREKDACIHTLD